MLRSSASLVPALMKQCWRSGAHSASPHVTSVQLPCLRYASTGPAARLTPARIKPHSVENKSDWVQTALRLVRESADDKGRTKDELWAQCALDPECLIPTKRQLSTSLAFLRKQDLVQAVAEVKGGTYRFRLNPKAGAKQELPPWFPEDALKCRRGFERADLVAVSALERGTQLAEPKFELVRSAMNNQRQALLRAHENDEAAIAKGRGRLAGDLKEKRSQDVRARLRRNMLRALDAQEEARINVLRMVSTLRVYEEVDWGEGLTQLERPRYDSETRRRKDWLQRQLKAAEEDILRTKRHVSRFRWWLRVARSHGLARLATNLTPSGGIGPNLFPEARSGGRAGPAWQAEDEAAFRRLRVTREAEKRLAVALQEEEAHVRAARSQLKKAAQGSMAMYCYEHLQRTLKEEGSKVEAAEGVLVEARRRKAERRDWSLQELQDMWRDMAPRGEGGGGGRPKSDRRDGARGGRGRGRSRPRDEDSSEDDEDFGDDWLDRRGAAPPAAGRGRGAAPPAAGRGRGGGGRGPRARAAVAGPSATEAGNAWGQEPAADASEARAAAKASQRRVTAEFRAALEDASSAGRAQQQAAERHRVHELRSELAAAQKKRARAAAGDDRVEGLGAGPHAATTKRPSSRGSQSGARSKRELVQTPAFQSALLEAAQKRWERDPTRGFAPPPASAGGQRVSAAP